MNKLTRRWIPTLFATLVALVVLAGYLVPNETLQGLRDLMVEGAVIVAAFALLLGGFNVLRVHGRKVRLQRPGWFYSVFLLLAAIAAFAITLRGTRSERGMDQLTEWMVTYVMRPLGGSLAALVAFALLLAAFRLLRTRRRWESVLFILVAAVVALGATPLTGLLPTLGLLDQVRAWVIAVPGMAGMRGLLLGVVLGTIITALRVMLTIDRPHGES